MEISQKQNILAFEHDSDFWVDMGNPAALKKGSDLITRMHDQ
jgi:NDP-sugar pyrophosphorylase family protein